MTMPGDRSLNERLLDLLVFIPAGMAVSAAEELPRLAAKGREHFGVRVISARAVGHFAVKKGQTGARTAGPVGCSAGRRHRPGGTSARRSLMVRPRRPSLPGPAVHPAGPQPPASERNGHVPLVSTLAIPGFDTLSASQVVQRLDGLTRAELVSVRAYEASTRGRRTILSRVDQLLDERS